MRHVTSFLMISGAVIALAGCAERASDAPAKSHIDVTAAGDLLTAPYTGRVYVTVSADDSREPRLQSRWFNPPLTVIEDVENWSGSKPVSLDADDAAHPGSLGDLEPGTYQAQAYIRLSPTSPDAGRGAGDLYSEPTELVVAEDGTFDLDLSLSMVVEEEAFDAPDQVSVIKFPSGLLSAFHGEDYAVDVSIRLPKDWSADSEETWPVLYYIGGFGSDHTALSFLVRDEFAPALDEMILIVPNALNYWGHSVFADSANTGPWGEMFVSELAPYIDATYHGVGPDERYVTGISSGGWSSLWLQVEYPEAFAGVWSIVPDPVDFRDFQQIDLYAEGSNMFTDEAGQPRPLARQNGEAILFYEDFVNAETIYGPGGQIRSFEAVFSPRGEDGLPQRIFDPKTGEVFTDAVEDWKPYDINLKVQEEWDTIGPSLEGKIRIYAGGEDTFYLEGATELLAVTLEELGSDAHVEIVPGLPHRPKPGVAAEMLEEITGVSLGSDGEE
ncbi:alpha/beta hydrolase-fold protein [Parvularcula marina]|uniref:alpha/beta hydrolase-fold protein n=1 Tax=Parvularcula marina TaxID=2292771 RepID=UPI003514CA56